MPVSLTSTTLVRGLIRRANAAGGNAVVVAKGDDIAGTILVMCMERGQQGAIIERVLSLDGNYVWRDLGVARQKDAVEAYIVRRRQSDPDIWVIELDIADAERFTAETLDHH